MRRLAFQQCTIKPLLYALLVFLFIPLIPSQSFYIAHAEVFVLQGRDWSYSLNFVPKNAILDARVVDCESEGVNISRLDSNHRYSDGVAQFNRGADGKIGGGTWAWMEKESGIVGSPIIPADAIQVLDWAISHGQGRNWTCYRRIEGVHKPA